jgi:hypothetical protein
MPSMRTQYLSLERHYVTSSQPLDLLWHLIHVREERLSQVCSRFKNDRLNHFMNYFSYLFLYYLY